MKVTHRTPEALAEKQLLDEFEAELATQYEPAHCPVSHLFTPGLYVRQMLIPAGTALISLEHLTEHPFVVMFGRLRILSTTDPPALVEGGHIGVTQSGTRRVAFAEEDTLWVTFHATEETDIEKIVTGITADPDNPLIPEELRSQWRESLPQSQPPHLEP